MIAMSPSMVLATMREQARMPALFERLPIDELLRTLTPSGVTPKPPTPAMRRSLHLADVLGARIPGMPRTCLYRSLARYAVLRRAGVPVRFVMGVAPSGGEEAHAWLELDGRPFEELGPREWTVTFAHPS